MRAIREITCFAGVLMISGGVAAFDPRAGAIAFGVFAVVGSLWGILSDAK